MSTVSPTPADNRVYPLTSVRASKGGLTLAETWRLVHDLASELGERRLAGEQRASLSPEHIELVRHGSNYRASIFGDGATSRTAGALFTAPEVVSGGRSSESSDVWMAARIAFWAAAPNVRPVVGEYLRGALGTEPDARPSLAALTAESAENAAPGITVPDVVTDVVDVATPAVPRAARSPRMRRNKRLPRSRWRPATGVIWTLIFVAGTATLTYGVMSAFRSNPVPADSAAPIENEFSETPEAILSRLTSTRDHALGGLDEDLLATVTVPGSLAAQADAQLLASFIGSAPEGLTTELQVTNAVVDGERMTIQADLAQQAFLWRGGARDGTHVGQLPPRCAQFDLVVFQDEWRVDRVNACAASATSG